MTSEPVPFIANIVLVALADGSLSAAEMGHLDAIRRELRLKKGDYNAAVKLAQGGGYRMTPVGSFADQARNLELILRVAYADDDVDAKAEALIREFCNAIGLHDEQLERIRGEVLSSLRQRGKACRACGAEVPVDSRFCAKCGATLDQRSESIQVQFDIPGSGVAIEFADSTAASFPKALSIARETPGYQSCQKGKKQWHLAVYSSGKLTDALPLVESLSGIRNRALYVDGQERPWDEVFGFVWCASQRARAYRPTEYCFGKDDNRVNPWGCKLSRMEWTEWASWFCYGRWEKTGLLGKKVQWRFDKERIRHELASNLYPLRFCPHLRPELAEAVLRHLPDVVVPGSDLNWDYHQQFEEVPGAIKILQEDRSGGFAFKTEFWADGVRPKGLGVLGDILTRAFQELQWASSSVQALLK